MESRPFLDRIPDQMLISTVIMDGPTHIQATRDSKGTYAFVYSASGNPFAVDFSRLSGKRLKAWWFDPRTGKAEVHAEEMYNELGPVDFKPPTSGDGQDWVLVLDDTAMGYPAPGVQSR
ncbi:MAG: hypothetical protein EOP84_23595 [Verrucomicrobiaceae bacterium]|nr:MAG: hypothetical protein EOP84_23595 [Verrucomicrobiaceae bacterium]